MTDDWLNQVDPNAALTLSVGWRSGQKLRLRRIPVSPEVGDAFRQVVTLTLDDMRAREQQVWTPEADFSPELFLTLPNELLGEAPILASEHGGTDLATLLAEVEGIPGMAPEEIPTANLELYVVTVGDTPGSRISFLRRSNPRRGLRSGKFFTSYHDVLARIDGPVFGFDETIDLVLTPAETHVLAPSAFQAMFRDQEALKAQVPKWSSELANHLVFSPQALERLSEKALRDRRISNRLEMIVSRGHLHGVAPEALRENMDSVGLDSSTFFNVQDERDFSEDQVPTLLYFLNEDLFYGVITNDGFRADKKAAR